MIEVRNLSKRYAATQAVDDISFRVEKGEVMGFLGPNGAGKTTTMRMLTCFMPPTSGSAIVAGHNILDESMEVRQSIGYLPENVPLYPDMRVNEFLEFRARLKGVSKKQLRARVQTVLEQCRLTGVRHRIIGQLSKGYRQRVGLAEAMVHDPKVLILDEPTIGLDPNQIRQVRALIRELGGEYTILLSTHILPEVESVCGRVIIIDRGRLVAMDTPERLVQQIRGGARLILEVRGPGERVAQALRDVPGMRHLEWRGNGISTFDCEVEKNRDIREDVFALIVKNGWILREMKSEELSLEEIFVHITTREQERVNGITEGYSSGTERRGEQ